MSRFGTLVCLVCFVAAINSCLIPDKKDGQEVHVFHIGQASKQDNEPEIIELHIPDARKKRGTPIDSFDYGAFSCQSDQDCPPGGQCSLARAKCYKFVTESTTLPKFNPKNPRGNVYQYFLPRQ